LPTGFRDLDKLTSGLQPSDLILVRSAAIYGEDRFYTQYCTKCWGAPTKNGGIFSLEMSKDQLVQRLLCQISHLDSQKLRTGQLNSDAEWSKLTDACDKLYQSPIYIDDTPGITVSEMRSKARRLKSEHGLDLIIVDYLQLMQGSSRRSNENRQQEISEISRSLKALARELKVPLIALSQLSRSVESRQEKKPMLSDLRESGALEQDADIVSFLYREGYYNPESDRKDITEVIVAKHRNGPVGTVELFFKSECTCL